MPTNFELKRLKPKLDIAKKPENRVHELTDFNVSLHLTPRRWIFSSRATEFGEQGDQITLRLRQPESSTDIFLYLGHARRARA